MESETMNESKRQAKVMWKWKIKPEVTTHYHVLRGNEWVDADRAIHYCNFLNENCEGLNVEHYVEFKKEESPSKLEQFYCDGILPNQPIAILDETVVGKTSIDVK